MVKSKGLLRVESDEKADMGRLYETTQVCGAGGILLAAIAKEDSKEGAETHGSHRAVTTVSACEEIGQECKVEKTLNKHE